MTGRRLYWALKKNDFDYLSWTACAIMGVGLPMTTIHYQSTALFETRAKARYVASKLKGDFTGYQPIRVRVDLVEVI